MPNGWPLGLEIMNMRFRVVESFPAAVEPYSLHVPSASFSSFSSSNLETEVIPTNCVSLISQNKNKLNFCICA